MSIPTSCDVVVIGGGPAGSTAASLLAEKGVDVVLLEKAEHPRFTVGESLLPHAWRFFDLLGVTAAIEREGFVAKQGGTVVWDGRIRQLSFSSFGFTRPGLHTERAAWAIDRSLRNPARARSNREIFAHQFRGRYELARAMAIPGRPLSPEDRRTARDFLGFQSDAEQDLMYTAAMLTTRSANFNSISRGFDEAARLSGKYRELETIHF